MQCETYFSNPIARFRQPRRGGIRQNLSNYLVKVEPNSEQETLSISKEAINKLPLRHYEGPIEIIDHDDKIDPAISELHTESIVGFDTESRPSFRKGESFPPSLIQLASENKVYLIQLGKIKRLEAVFSILAEPGLMKVGIAIHDDIKRLQDIQNFTPKGFLDLSTVSQENGVLNTGLRSLSALFLNFRISKSAQVTNWSRKTLTHSQVKYAATDAWVGRELYLHFAEIGFLNK